MIPNDSFPNQLNLTTRTAKVVEAIRESWLTVLLVDGCYSSKFLRSSARRYLLEMLVRGTRYEVARAGLVH